MVTHGERSGMQDSSKLHSWRIGTVTHIMEEAPGLRSFMFTFDEPVTHDAGQHYEIRLTADDGYQAARLYSAATPANGTGNMLQLTIALMPNGEVSPYLFNHIRTGSKVELRGPLGNYFTWTNQVADPILLIGGGTGIVPLRAIRLSHQQRCMTSPIKLLYSVKTYADMAYKYEMFPRGGEPSSDMIMTFTELAPEGWQGYARRIDGPMLQEVLAQLPAPPLVYICGPTPMVESVADALVAGGVDPNRIKTERFGPTS